MNIWVVIFEIIADITLLLTIFIAVEIFTFNSHRIKLTEIIASTIVISLIGAIVYITVYDQSEIFRWLMIIANYLKFCLAVIIVYKEYSIKVVCTALIVQFLCELLNFTTKTLIPSETKLHHEWLNLFALLIIRLGLLIILFVIFKKTQNIYFKNTLNLIPNYIFILVLISIIISSGLVSTADFETPNIESKIELIKIFSLAVVLCLILILLSLLASVMAKKYHSDLNHILEEQVQAQISYYEQREKANTELRKFKHDYNNHINCIQALISSGRYDEVSEYLNKLSDLFPSDSFLYKTGNYLSDAILTDKQENAKKDKIQISFSGTIPTSINNTDLCIILSNALDNAIEASRMYEGEKEISVYGGYRHGYFILVMKNPTVNNISDNVALPATTKEDKLRHGFGLLNINTVVEKYNGFMKTECKDNQFVLSLTFNSVTSNAD